MCVFVCVRVCVQETAREADIGRRVWAWLHVRACLCRSISLRMKVRNLCLYHFPLFKIRKFSSMSLARACSVSLPITPFSFCLSLTIVISCMISPARTLTVQHTRSLLHSHCLCVCLASLVFLSPSLTIVISHAISPAQMVTITLTLSLYLSCFTCLSLSLSVLILCFVVFLYICTHML